ncbi:hypothetical protein SLA2020_013120 [Shorea laevis]
MESVGLTERPYDDNLQAMPKQGKQRVAVNNGRWIHNTSSNPIREVPRWRSQNPQMERHPVLEPCNFQGGMIDINSRDWQGNKEDLVGQIENANMGTNLKVESNELNEHHPSPERSCPCLEK